MDLRHREESKPCHKGVRSQLGDVVPDGSSGLQEQEAAPQGRGEGSMKTGTVWTCEVVTCGLLAGATGTSVTKSACLGMEHLAAAGSGEVKTWRGGAVVKAEAEAILNELGPK